MLNKYLNICLKGYHTPWVPTCFLSSAGIWGIREIKSRKHWERFRGQRSVSREESWGSWVCIPLSAGVSVRLLTFIYRREQQRNFCKSSKKEGTALCQRGGSFRKAEKVTVNVKCCSEVQWDQKKPFYLTEKKSSGWKNDTLNDSTD